MRFSVVTPARNEEKCLLRLLETVETAREAYCGGVREIETIVADNVSTDRTAEIARTKGARVVAVEKRVIGPCEMPEVARPRTFVPSRGMRAKPVVVRYAEGLVHGFLSLRTLDGNKIADGQLIQFGEVSSVEIAGPTARAFSVH